MCSYVGVMILAALTQMAHLFGGPSLPEGMQRINTDNEKQMKQVRWQPEQGTLVSILIFAAYAS